MARLDIERQIEETPKRKEFARKQLEKRGYEITDESDSWLKFEYKGNTITLFPYSGWWTGKGIGSGRGLMKMLAKLK